MGKLRIPSMQEILAVAQSRGQRSENPSAWKGLVGAWPIQEGAGSKAYDVSGYGNHGTLTNMDPATDWVVSDNGRALDFDVSNDYATASNLPSPGTNGPFSCIATIKPNAVNSYMAICGNDSNGATGFVFGLGNVSGALIVYNRGTATHFSSSSVLVAGAIVRVALSFRLGTNNTKLYHKGIQTGEGTFVLYPGDGTAFEIGRRGFAATYFNGRISNLLIYLRALTPSEIAADYADPWAMYRLRRKVFAATLAPTGNRRRRLLFAS